MHKLILFLFFPVLLFGQKQAVDFQTVQAEIKINALEKQVSGTVIYQFKPTENLDSLWLNAYDMTFVKVSLKNTETSYKNTDNKLILYKKFKKDSLYRLMVQYQVMPKKAMYFVGWHSKGRKQVWTQGQGKDNSHWLPLYDEQTDKVIFDMKIAFDKNYTVVSNGLLQDTIMLNTRLKQWHYKMEKPMSSYLLMLAIGKYEKTVNRSKNGILLENYYYPEEKQYTATTYKYNTEIFNFMEQEIGVPFPWKVYRNIPAQDFLYGGMENTTSTLYNENYMVDSIGFVDRNFINVNAHELAHQWFGDYITASESKHHWLHEGFATYYALLAEKEIFGGDYFEAKIYQNAQNIITASKHDTIPILNGKASSLSFYKKGAWVLYNLNRKIGKEAFDKAVKNYLKKYAFKIVETSDFIQEINTVTQTDNQLFFDNWLNKTAIPKDNLSNSAYNKQQILVAKIAHDYSKSKALFMQYLADKTIHSSIKIQLLENLFALKPKLDKGLIALILKSSSIPLHKVLLGKLAKISSDQLALLEKLLNDKSYQVQEDALVMLWINNPTGNNKYLEKLKNTIGFNNYNIKTLWYFLAIIDTDYKPEKTSEFLDKLTYLTGEKYRFTIRQNAFDYLHQLHYYSPTFYSNLAAGARHFNWRFASYSRKLLKEITTIPRYQKELQQFLPMLNEKDRLYLQTFIK